MLADALEIDSAWRIEGFDVSHAQGKAAVGSNVTFVDGSAEKSDYRRKKLTDQNDDYDNMRALLEWRASRAVEERDDRPDPDLLLIDGGEGQLEAACDALEAVDWDVPAVALLESRGARGHARRTFSWPSDAPHLHLLQRVRDEAHRFAVQYHQTIRDEVKTVLDDVRGESGQKLESSCSVASAASKTFGTRVSRTSGASRGSAKRLPRRLNLGSNSSRERMEGLNRLFIALSICEWNDEFWCERVRRSVLLPWQQGFATPSPADFCSRRLRRRSHGMRDLRSRTIHMVRGTDGPALTVAPVGHSLIRCQSTL